MRVSLSLLGVEVFALDLGPVQEPCTCGEVVDTEVVSELEPYQDAGTTSAYPIGFSVPVVPWEDPGSLHQFDPEPDGENP